MFRALLRLGENNINNSFDHPNSLFYQTVRWRRKPRWLPTAKSKIFRVPERLKLPLEEQEELRRLFNIYRTEMKSIRCFLADQIKTSTGEVKLLTIAESEKEEHQNCIKLNEQWNKDIAQIRKETLAKENEAELEEILRIIEDNKIQMEKRKEEVEEIVRMEKERSKSYITPENIDNAIDAALENFIDYNFSIDLDGNLYHGRNTKPPKAVSSKENKEKEPEAAVAAM